MRIPICTVKLNKLESCIENVGAGLHNSGCCVDRGTRSITTRSALLAMRLTILADA